MSETAKVRLVRCPKCENLLPEVADYSVYECGGCGAVLRAKNKGVDLDSFSVKSDEEVVGNAVDKLSDSYEKMNVSEKRLMDASDGSENDARSGISSSSRAERRILRDRAEIYRSSLMDEGGQWNLEEDARLETKSNELRQEKFSEEDVMIRDEDENGVWRSGELENGRSREKSETNSFRRAQRMDADARFGKDSPSDRLSRSSFDYENPTRNRNGLDGFSNGDYVGEDRAELFKKLDELKDKISKSGNLMDKGKGKVLLDRRMDPYASENWHPETSLGINREPVPYSYSDAQFRRSPHHNQYAEPPPLGGNGFYPPRYIPDHAPGYADPLRFGRGPPQAPAPYHHARSHVSGPYMDDGMGYMDPMEPYPPNLNRHHPSCACLQCHNRRQVPVPPPFHPTAYSDRYSVNYHDNNDSFGSRDYSHSSSNPHSVRTHHPSSHTRWPSDVTSEMDGFAGRRPPRVKLASGGLHRLPIAGGAPIVACCNCFELLILPKKVLSKNKNRRKIICGACSTTIVFAVSDGKLVVSVDIEGDDAPTNVDDKYGLTQTHDDSHLNGTRSTFSSDDYIDSGIDFHSMDREISNGMGRGDKSSKMNNHNSASVYGSEVEEDRETPIAARKDSNTAEQAMKHKRPPGGSSLQEHFEYSNVYRVANHQNKSEEHDRVLPKKATNPPIFRKDSVATEIDLSSNEYCNTGTTFDSGEGSKGDGSLKGSRAESFFAGIMKKSSKDSRRSQQFVEQEVANVTVNGHLIPDRLVKKAERLAGPIGPGHYWYDFRAGFWGIIGGPCRGIIPPFIEEFNYPMPEHCAAGNTRVSVNGRELNQKDLNLLASRGLPTERDRSYIVEISGRVLDEDTGEELDGLGKLAPTVEKNKRGFGMAAPQAVA